MDLNWSTFLLEIINFLVLVWILKRFLYHPVISALEQRRKSIEEKLNEANNKHKQAIALEKQYKQRLEEWALEKQKLKESLQNEILTERTKKLDQLQTEITGEREKTAVAEQRKLAETLRQYQLIAHEQGARFATKILTSVANKELESRLFDLLIETFDSLNKEQKMTLMNACTTSVKTISVTSCYELSEPQQDKLKLKLSTLCKQNIHINYDQDSNLIAGLRIRIGASVLSLNLKDELKGFAELIHENK